VLIGFPQSPDLKSFLSHRYEAKNAIEWKKVMKNSTFFVQFMVLKDGGCGYIFHHSGVLQPTLLI